MVDARLSPDAESIFHRRNFPNTSSDNDKLILYYNNIRMNIWTFVPPMIITLGILCNFLSFTVWVRSLVKKRGSSSSYFFACLSVADIFVLIFVPLFNHVGIAYNDDIHLKNYSNFTCKFHYYMVGFSLTFTSYVLASLAVFRMVGALFPHRYKHICNARRAKIILACIIAFSLLARIPTLFTFKLTNIDGKQQICRRTGNLKTIRLFIFFWGIIVTYFVPMFLIVFGNVGIIWKLARKRANSIWIANKNTEDHAFSRTVRVLIAISLVYLLTMWPMSVYLILRGARVWPETPAINLARYRLGFTIVSNVSLLNSMLNFPVYCLTHPHFITEVKDCFRACSGCFSSTFLCKKRNTVGVAHGEVGTAGSSGTQTISNKATAPEIIIVNEDAFNK